MDEWPWLFAMDSGVSPLFRSRCCIGVHIKYDDSETPKDVKKWNVSVVSVNKHKRHLDPTAAHSFWRLVDDHIARRKKEKAGAAPARRKK